MRAALVGGGLLAAAAALGFSGVSCVGASDHVVAVRHEECVTCHRDEALSAVEPPHHDWIEDDCGNCHGETAWRPADAPDHDRFFPLEGVHVTIDCADCHAVGFEPGDTPEACVACHRDDFARSTLPGHETFSMECGDCHTAAGWKPATLPDHDLHFPLDGAHAAATCARCHESGYSPGTLPTTCVGCHQTDYDASPYPGHADFPTTCADCHTTTGWVPASGGTHPEDAFRVESGPHEGIECLECHDTKLGPMGAGNTRCVGCHERSKEDEEHHEVRDYPSGGAPVNFCLDCHPDGRHE